MFNEAMVEISPLDGLFWFISGFYHLKNTSWCGSTSSASDSEAKGWKLSEGLLGSYGAKPCRCCDILQCLVEFQLEEIIRISNPSGEAARCVFQLACEDIGVLPTVLSSMSMRGFGV